MTISDERLSEIAEQFSNRAIRLWGEAHVGELGSLFTELLSLRQRTADMARALTELRGMINLPGMAECPHDDPSECPWSENHEMVAIIDATLSPHPQPQQEPKP